MPPPPDELANLLADWERFAHEESDLPLLVQNALLHYQFETLHPFLDGNGRLGRLLIVFLLVERGRLSAPLLYVSAYLESDRDRYYEALQTVRERGPHSVDRALPRSGANPGGGRRRRAPSGSSSCASDTGPPRPP